MSLYNRALISKANSLKGRLAHLKTTTGRRRHETDEDILVLSDPFLVDETKILRSKRFRCLGEKTQVFTLPKTALTRTRMTHVMEVVGTTTTIADLLGLNVNLARSAALVHDVGHVPFGHQGEMWMAQAMGRKEFCHERLCPIMMQRVERSGRGINLTFETLEGGMRHSGNLAIPEMSQEAWCLTHGDKFTYIFHDLNDIGIRARFPIPKEIEKLANEFGKTQRQRTSTVIAGLVIESVEAEKVSFEHSEIAQKFYLLRKLMYDLYPRVTQQNVNEHLEPIIESLTLLRLADPFFLLSLMTDRDVLRLKEEPMKDADAFMRTTAGEVVKHLETIGPVDLCDPGLDW